MFTLLTATGARRDAWKVCEKLMAAQDYPGPVKWVIVDDGADPQPIKFARPGWDLQIIRPKPFWKTGQNTQARNLAAGLKVIEPDERVAIIEDDDWYSPDWLSTLEKELESAELVGEPCARYYNVKLRRARQLNNRSHSSLCSSAVRARGLEAFRKMVARPAAYIDMQLWRSFRISHLFPGHRVVGMKGLPGRGGIGMGHRGSFRGQYDPNGKLLRAWIGADVRLYKCLM